ncbi:MAG: TRAP transporter permease [Thermodesulfobacteriota bacterium]|nr:TRAP transporter permease [Thermodesulfobacteriota bacterium]
MDEITKFTESGNTGKYLGWFITLLAVVFSLYHLYFAGVGIISLSAARHTHLILSMALIFLTKPFSKKSPYHWSFYFDLLLIVLGVIIGIYLEIESEALEWRMGDPNTPDFVLGIIAILLTLEITRRTVGIPLVITSVLFMAYAYFGALIPGYFGHRGYNLHMMVNSFYIEMRGIYGTSLGVVVEFVVLFITFGAFLQKTGGGDFFVQFAHALTGQMRGGPAKTAVIASAFMGSISGSATANVVTTGSFTIPMMKKAGYPAHLAAGVEVASSIGGVILPPIMGAAAFLIVALTGIPYGAVVKGAVIPAIMYFVGVYAAVHFTACKLGLKGIPDEGDYWKNLLLLLKKGIIFIVPLVILFLLLVAGYSPTYSAFITIILLFVLSYLKKETRMGIKDIIDALKSAALNSLSVSAACACVGLIVGVVGLTGVGVKFSSLIVAGSGGNLFLAILFVGLASLVLGIELPITASYLVLAVIAGPALQNLGVPVLVAHLVILWFSIDASVTPPVCITSYVAAGLAKADPFKTAMAGWRFAKGLYLIPFLMVFTPITGNGPLPQVLISTVTGMIGLISLSAAWQGWFLYETGLIQRIILGIVAICSIDPGFHTDLVGVGLFTAILVVQWFRNRKKGPLKEAPIRSGE